MTPEELGTPFATGRSAQIFAWPGSDLALKLFAADYPRAQVDLEEQSLQVAADLGVRAPGSHGQVQVGDRPGLLMDRVAGDSLTARAERNPLTIRAGAQALADTHIRLHARPTRAFTDVRQAAIDALDSAPLAFLTPAGKDTASRLIGALPAGDRMLHMDFHTENVFHDADGYVVLDWQTTLRGDPAADVAMTALLLRDVELWPGTPWLKRVLVQRIRGIVTGAYLGRYQQVTGMGTAQISAWRLPCLVVRMSSLDIPSEHERFAAEVESLVARP